VSLRHTYIVLSFPSPPFPPKPFFQSLSLGSELLPSFVRLESSLNMTTAGIEPVAIPPDNGGVGERGERTWGLRARVDPTVTFE
jgi:hypothetical protein